jgi:hypothetical protein
VILFSQIFLFAAGVRLLLRFELPKLGRWLEPGAAPPSPDPKQIKKITDYVEAAIAMGSPLVRNSCLTRGVTRYYFFRRAGLDVQLHFGMGQVKRGYAGHCWLVKDGEPFLEKEDPRPRFNSIYRFSADPV